MAKYTDIPALDALKTSVLDAGEYSAALQTLAALLGKLQHSPDEPKFRSLRLSNEALQQRLLQHEGGRVALKALGFTQEASGAAGPLSSPMHSLARRVSLAHASVNVPL